MRCSGITSRPAFFTSMLLLSLCCAAANGQTIDELKNSSMEKIGMIETEAIFNEADLGRKYITALEALEAKLTREGNLDAIVRVREEKDLIGKGGGVTTHADPGLVELREKYLNARKTIRGGVDDARRKLVDDITKQLKDLESAMVKAGKIDEALAFRKSGEELLEGLSAGVPAAQQEVFEDPREGMLAPLKAITVPQTRPPLNDKPFAKNGWLEPASMPAVRQRISEDIWIGNRGKGKWPLIFVPKGTSWAASRDVKSITISAGNMVATQSTFESMNLMADLACHYYFLNCSFDNCGFGKGGNWYGWDQAAKFYFENCLVTKRFNQGANIVDHGFRAQQSVFEKIDMPSINFREKEPVSYLNHPWMKFVNCRFVDCKIPSSFVLITRECLFVNCTFFDDTNLKKVDRPIEVSVFMSSGCRWDISKLPANVTILRKQEAEAAEYPIPSADSLRQKMMQ